MMKSTIRVDFCDRTGKGIEPIIRIFIPGNSDDPRDSLLKTLFQSTNDYLQIEYGEQKHITNSIGLPEIDRNLILFKPNNIEKLESPFVSAFLIGEEVSFASKEECDRAWGEAKKLNPGKPEDQIEWEPEYRWGQIVAVKFTPAKVYYDVLDNYGGKVSEGIPSHFVRGIKQDLAPASKTV